ncbi:MAG: CHAT domain-containing protein [Caldilinea sp. CFX5]|nr:CHAT domain-containing protein [Caldilinea sp. CFX5]
MTTTQFTTPEALYTYLQSLSDVQLPVVTHQQQLTVASVEGLKAYATQFYLTEPLRACRIAQEAYRLGRHLPMPAPALGAWALGNALMATDRFAEAVQRLEEGRAAYLAINQPLDAARMGVSLVFALAYSGQSEAAVALSVAIEPLLTTAAQSDPADLQRLGNLLLNAGVAYELLGQYEEALALYERQIAIAQRLADPLMLAQISINKAYALTQIGAVTEAVAAYQVAEQLLPELAAPADTIRFHYNYAALLSLMGDYAQARAQQDLAAKLIAHGGASAQQQDWLTLTRALLDLQADWPISPETLAVLTQAQAAFAQHGPAFAAGLAWIILARCHLQRQEWATAQAILQRVQEAVAQSADPLLTSQLWHARGDLAQAQQQPAAAVQAYQQAIRQIELLRSHFQIETLRADFLTDRLVVYQALCQSYAQQGETALAFQVIERAKARLLMEKLVFRLEQEVTHAVQHEDAEVRLLNQRLRELLQQVAAANRQLRLAEMQEGDSGGPLPTFGAASTLISLEEQAQSLIHQIQRRQPLFSVYATGQPAPLTKIQAQLGDRLLLQYHLHRQEIWVFLVTQAGIIDHIKLANLTDVERARQGLTLTTTRLLELSLHFGLERLQRYLPTLLAEANHHLRQLYLHLLQPLAAHLQRFPALVIVPDQALHYVPFQALYDGQAYLLESHTISYTPSATVLELALTHRATGENLLLCGYDNQELAAVSAELQGLQQLFPAADALIAAACTTDNFLRAVSRYRLVHLATHAKLRVDKPLLSSFTLADRQLTLAEIARLQLNADLVTLSACETGHGQVRGADLLSLAGGFLSAGANALVVSLWRVEDALSAPLMTTFYRALLAGAPRAAALREAQLALLHRGRAATDATQRYQHPAYWAPFILIGNWRPLDYRQLLR